MSYNFFYARVAAGISPCLMLHHGNFSSVELSDEVSLPHHVSCPVNMRKLDPTRLGVNCIAPGSMVEEVRNPSFLSGTYHMIVTSYETTTTNNYDAPVMKSTWNVLDDEIGDTICHHATPLKKSVIQEGIQWIRNEEVLSTESMESTESSLQSYFDALKEKIPLQEPLELGRSSEVLRYAHDFIKEREWPADASSRKEYILDCLDDLDDIVDDILFWKICSFVRRFIYENVAKQTKVIVHIVDGLHRLGALECALIGFQKVLRHGLSIGLPSVNQDIYIQAFLPTDGALHRNFLQEMKDKSSSIQDSIGCLQPHKKKDYFARILTLLDEECSGKYMDDDGVTSGSSIVEKIEFFSERIIRVIGGEISNRAYHHMVPGMDLPKLVGVDLSILFKKKSRSGGTFEGYSFLFDDHRLTVLHFISHHGGIRNKNRYSRPGLSAEVFELAQLMLWSRISKGSHQLLLNLFTRSSVSVRQITADDPNGTLMDQWISGLVDAVGTTVYYLYKLSVANHGGVLMGDGESHPEMVLMRLINSVLIGTIKFFFEHGLDPELPIWFEEIKQHMGDEKVREVIDMTLSGLGLGMDEVKKAEQKESILTKFSELQLGKWVNFMSFIRVSFALNLRSRILIETKGRSQVSSLEKLGVTNFCPGTILKKGDILGGTWTACLSEYASNFEDFEPDKQRTSFSFLRICIASKPFHRLFAGELQKKKKATASSNMEPYKPSEQEYASIREVMKHLKHRSVTECLKLKLSACGDDDELRKAKLNKLLKLIGDFPATLFDACYVEGRDLDYLRGSSEEEDDGAEDLY
jgi:hypothetical protein